MKSILETLFLRNSTSSWAGPVAKVCDTTATLTCLESDMIYPRRRREPLLTTGRLRSRGEEPQVIGSDEARSDCLYRGIFHFVGIPVDGFFQAFSQGHSRLKPD